MIIKQIKEKNANNIQVFESKWTTKIYSNCHMK